MGERLLRPKEAAKLLGVHPLTLYRWAKSGKIKYIKTPGGRLRYPLSEIQRLLKERKKEQVERIYKVAIYVKNPNQKKAQEIAESLKKYAEERDYVVVDVIIDTSGEICGRSEAMEYLLSLVKAGEIGKVIVPNKRTLSYFCFWVFEELFAAYGVSVEIVKEQKEEEYLELLDWLISIIRSKE